jgi:hypothetical protein
VSRAWVALAVCCGLTVGVACVMVGQARARPSIARHAGAPGLSLASHRMAASSHGVPPASGSPAQSSKGAPRSPSGPALAPGSLAGEEASASAPASGGDPLTGNGLDSPLCRQPDGLSAAQQRNCQTDDFVAAPDPTNDFAFDVNINTGISSWGNDMSATVDNFAQFGWMALVSATHGLMVMFEWCYSLNLLSGSLLSEVTGALRNARLTFTEPWLAIALACASTLVVYHGLVRRRVAETLGQVLAMMAMMVGGLWVIADPSATVGAVEQWANQAGLGTMAAVASGAPGHAERTLADSMQLIFASVITTPWCYVEFGDVGWCDNASLLDGGLKKAGLAIAAREQAKSGCRNACGAGASPGDRTLFYSASLLREAQTNGDLFLALPANEPERNSVTKRGTLLNVLCGGGGSADACRGSTGPQAEFRSQKGTESRVIGLLAIWLGALGMLLLLGYLALRLLGAALVGLFFLLLAPAAVLAPALGDGGRSAFRGWAMKLMEAIIAKLTYSFLLGVVLMMMRLLLGLTILGWWERWLLISAFWWGVFLRRDQTLGWAQGAGRPQSPAKQRSMARRVGEALDTPRALLHQARATRDKRRGPGPEVKPRPKPRLKPHATIPAGSGGQSSAGGGSGAGGSAGDGGNRKSGRGKLWQVKPGRGKPANGMRKGEGSRGNAQAARESKRESTGEAVGHKHGHRRGHGLAGERDAVQADGAAHAAHHGQLGRVRRERKKALANGDTRRAAKLGAREQRIEAAHARHKALALALVEPEVELGDLAVSALAGRQAGERSARTGAAGNGYIADGRSRAESHPDTRAGGGQAGSGVGGSAGGSVRGAPSETHASLGSRNRSATTGSHVGEQADARGRARQRSSVMDDAREVAARRKRQLGCGPNGSGGGPQG